MSHTKHDGRVDNCDACEVVRETVDLVKTALAAQCSCYFAGCVHDQVRWVAEHKYGLRDKLPEETPAWVIVREETVCPVCNALPGFYCTGPGSVQVSNLFDSPRAPVHVDARFHTERLENA